MFYRPGTPPRVTGASLARFVRAFAQLGVAKPQVSLGSSVKFGRGINQDTRLSSWIKWIGGIGKHREIKWDLDWQPQSTAKLADVLDKNDRPIYRAHLSLGPLTDEIAEGVHRVGSPDNKYELTPDSWSLEIGPVDCYSLETEDQLFRVGWIEVSLSGYGYLFPWTFRDLLQRAERLPGIRKVMDLCRSTWPVPSALPDQKTKKLRTRMGELWPYHTVDLPGDWYWGLAESG